MDSWTRLQVETYKKIERAYQNFKKSPKERITVSYVETRIEILEKQWLTFEEIDRKLITEYKREEYEKSAYHLSDICNQTEDLYTEYKTILKESLRKVTPNKKAVTDDCDEDGKQTQSGVKLPRIAIPFFSGHYSQWTTFRDLFQSLIHNNHSLDNVQKLHYLKSYLTGEAEQLLRHLPVTNDNYVTCWNILVHRFNNKKFITDSILKRFFSQKQITTESSNCLKELYDTTNEYMNALTNEGINIEHWDLIVIYILSSKLDQESRKQWEAKVCSLDNELPTLKQFLEFVEHRFRSLEFLCTNKNIKITSPRSHHFVNNVKESKASSCSYCSNNDHKIGNCNKFASLELTARRNFVQTSGLCFNCLGPHHSVSSCRLPTRCKICTKKHHSLLHSGTKYHSTDNVNEHNQAVDSSNEVVTAATPQDQSEVSNVTSCFANTNNEAILPTALAKAVTTTGSIITLRCLVDQGSQASFITEAAVRQLGLQRFNCNSVIQGVGGENNIALKSKHLVYVKLQSLQDPSFTVNVKAYVLSKLTSVLPERNIINKAWPNLPIMKLADPHFNVPNTIDVLLGAIVYSKIICEGLIKGPPGTPIAQETKLGWIISGEVGGDSGTNFVQKSNAIITLHTNICTNDVDIEQMDERESENYQLDKKQLSTEVITLLSKGSLESQKCSSNNKQQRKKTSKNNKVTISNIELKQNEIIKIPELTCNRRTDDVENSVQLLSISEPAMKRNIIYDIVRSYEPMKWLFKPIITAKIIMQKRWLTEKELNEKLPAMSLKKWSTYLEELAGLTKFKFPRGNNGRMNPILDCHGLNNAPTAPFAAAVYLRLVHNLRNVWVHLLTFKTNVIPIKQVFTPANCVSRGMSTLKVTSIQLRQIEPSWLKDAGINCEKKQILETELEEETQTLTMLTRSCYVELWVKFSSLRELFRNLAYCKRFIRSKVKYKHNHNFPAGFIRAEWNESILCLKQCQEMSYLQEI